MNGFVGFLRFCNPNGADRGPRAEPRIATMAVTPPLN
jgi:hypothetical protein